MYFANAASSTVILVLNGKLLISGTSDTVMIIASVDYTIINRCYTGARGSVVG
jgi:hypothetical protein